jgi:hypothetical protein
MVSLILQPPIGATPLFSMPVCPKKEDRCEDKNRKKKIWN